MYTRTTTISDLLTADGKRISKDIYQVSSKRMSVTPSSTAYEWPNVPEPSRNEKNLWQTTIKIILGVTRATLEVEQDTRFAWDVDYTKYAVWNVTPDRSTLYQKHSENKWIIWRRTPTRRRNPTYITENFEVEISPEQLHPCTRTYDNDEATITCIGTYSELEEDKDLHHETGWILPRLEGNNHEEQQFIDEITSGKGQIVSCKNGHSSSAFVVLPSKIIHGSNTVPGEPEDQSSYRGELGGILASIC